MHVLQSFRVSNYLHPCGPVQPVRDTIMAEISVQIFQDIFYVCIVYRSDNWNCTESSCSLFKAFD